MPAKENGKTFSTTEAAKICSQSIKTIVRRFDAGKISGYRTGKNRVRKIPLKSLIRYMIENNIPLHSVKCFPFAEECIVEERVQRLERAINIAQNLDKVDCEEGNPADMILVVVQTTKMKHMQGTYELLKLAGQVLEAQIETSK